MTEELCNNGNTAITSVAASTNTFGTNCFNYGTAGSAAFVPPIITSPTTCTDAVWGYYLASVTPAFANPLYSNLYVSVDPTNNLVNWITRPGQTTGYDASHDYGTYSFTFNAALPDNPVSSSVTAFTIDIITDCCYSPTVITFPTTTAASYTYTIGDTLVISLSGPFSADNSCCVVQTDAPTISPTPPAGLFTISGDNLSVTVNTVDVTPTGPSGITYTISTTGSFPSANALCVSATAPVQYDVVIVNPCETAVFQIDDPTTPAIFLIDPAISKEHYIAMTTSTLVWDSSTDITVNIVPSSLCGTIVQELYDYTSLSEVALDSTDFTWTTSGTTETISIISNDLAKAGTYRLRLKVYYQDFQSQTEINRDFLIDLKNPCLIATFTIDDSVLMADPAISMTQFVNYAAQQLAWTDTIVTSDVIAIPDPCGAFTHEVTGPAGEALSTYSSIIPTFDLASATKYLDVETTDFTQVGSYQFVLNVYYTSYSSNVHSKNFNIEIIDYCDPITVNTQLFDADPTLTYTLGQTAVSTQFVAAWTTVPTVCNLTFLMTMTPSTTGYIVFDGIDKVTASGNDPFECGDYLTGTYTPGTYTLEIRAWADNSVDTRVFINLDVTIVDPCDSGTITIDPSIISPNPITYKIYDPADVQTFVATEGSTVFQSELAASCPPIQFSVTDTSG